MSFLYVNSDLEGISDANLSFENHVLLFKVIDNLGNEVLADELSFEALVFEDGYIKSKNDVIGVNFLTEGLYFLEVQLVVLDEVFFNYSHISIKQYAKFIKKLALNHIL